MLVAIFIKKKCIFVIFCKFKKRNPRAVGKNRRILDRNVLVTPVGNKVGNAIERRPYVLYSLIGERPNGGHSMEGVGFIEFDATKRHISSDLV